MIMIIQTDLKWGYEHCLSECVSEWFAGRLETVHLQVSAKGQESNMVVLERREAAGTRPWLSSEISEEKIIITWVQMSGSASQKQERTLNVSR